VAVEPVAHLIQDLLARYHDRRWHRELVALPDPATAERFNVPALMARVPFAGRAYVLFGTRRENEHPDAVHLNAIHAHWIALSDRVTLCPFPEVNQDTLDWLSRGGAAEEVLSQYFFADMPAVSSPPALPPLDKTTLLAGRKFFGQPRITLCRIDQGGT